MSAAPPSPAAHGPALLRVEALSLAVQGRPLLTDLHWVVEPGQRWCVIGRNASGKSTLLRALAGLDVPDLRGRILLQGDARRLDDAAGAARLRAYMPQQTQDRFALSVRELLALQSGAPADAAQVPGAAVEALTRALDVEALLDRSITRLSGGERQRVALAAVARQAAPLWLLDEPVSFQDPAHQRMVSRWLCQQSARAVVLSAHDMGWVQRSATHVLALTGGGGWRAGPVAQLLDADTLRATFDCGWTLAMAADGPVWLAD